MTQGAVLCEHLKFMIVKFTINVKSITKIMHMYYAILYSAIRLGMKSGKYINFTDT